MQQTSWILGVLAAALLAVLGVDRLSAAENWPQFRGPTCQGHADDADVPTTWSETENVAWKTAIHGRGWSSPIVWGDQVWLTTATADGKQMFAVCVDRDSGKIVHDLKLFENDKPEEIHELNSYASPTPCIEAGRVYVHFGSYGTACIDTASGKTLWQRRDLPCNHFRGPGSSPMFYGDAILIHYDGYDFQYVVALDKRTGETVWRSDRQIDFGTDNGDFKKAYCTPLLIETNGRKQLISPASKAVVALDPDTGKEIWTVRYSEFSATARPVFGHGLVFVNTGFGKAELWAIRPGGEGDVTETHVAWRVSRQIGSKPSPVLVGDNLYQIHDSGVATALDARTGKEVWTKRLSGQFSASLLASQGNVFLFSQQGPTYVVKAGNAFEQIGENKLDAGCMASPAVAGNALFVRTETHLYRIEKK
ncbi:MAG: quinonprotein alcohol dehydrogenase [Planctomycetota bacterium]|nr:MAG: quinonprotein alcohol dehydrogenase [Planctomycetota bacterium]